MKLYNVECKICKRTIAVRKERINPEGNICKKCSGQHYCKGRKASDETRKKQSLSHKGKEWTALQRIAYEKNPKNELEPKLIEWIKNNPHPREKEAFEASYNKLYYTYQERAIKKQIEFNLDKELFIKLCKSNCYFCGIEPSTLRKNLSRLNGNPYFNGIDRLNPNFGYIKENVVACCKRCNYGKWIDNKEDFYGWIKKVYEHSNLGKVVK